jgi:hypothetical protein
VTGREAIKEVTGDEKIADRLANAGFVCVPREPTKKMLDAAWADALAENADGVWATMIDASEELPT